MFKLIRLEWKKNNVKKAILSALIMILILAVFIFIATFFGTVSTTSEGEADIADGLVISLVEILTGMSFLVFAGTLFSSFIVSTYKNKTMALMFSYPIKRKKIMLSQMLAVWILSFVLLVVAKLFIYCCILVGLRFFTSQFLIEIDMTSLSFYLTLVVNSLVMITMSFVTLFVGIMMKSSKATIVSAIILIVLTQVGFGDLTLANFSAFQYIMAAVGVISAFLCMLNVEKKDLM